LNNSMTSKYQALEGNETAQAVRRSWKVCTTLCRVSSLSTRLCAWSWLVRHPVNMEITRSSGGITPQQEFFFFCLKIKITMTVHLTTNKQRVWSISSTFSCDPDH
jgi:hypothetical protein